MEPHFVCATHIAALALAASACSSNQQAIGADLREAVPFYVCSSLNASRAIGGKPAGTDPVAAGPVAGDGNGTLPDQLQVQVQATTTTTQQHQGQVGIGTPIVLNYQGQFQRGFADSHQVTLQYNAEAVKELAKRCSAGVVRPKPLQVTASPDGIRAESLQ